MKQHWKNDHSICEVVKNADIPAHMQDKIREVVGVWTDPEHRGQGYATELMKAVCDEADIESMVLMLQPRAYAGGEVGRDKLIAWYKRFGFIKTQDNPVLMARAPTFKVRQSMVGAAVEVITRG